MFFLLRCAFWLGLVFSAMQWPGDAPKLPNANEASAQVAAHVATGVRKVCTRNPAACLEAASVASDFLKSQDKPGDKPADKPAAKPAGRGVDTLAAVDRSPVWRGRN